MKNIKLLKTSIGSFFGGYTEIAVNFEKSYFKYNHSLPNKEIKQDMTNSEIALLINGLEKLKVLEWKDEYMDNDILDGVQWEAEIVIGDRKVQKAGSNDYPDNWDQYCALISTVTKQEL